MDTNDSGFEGGENEERKGEIANWFKANWKMILATIAVVCIGIGVYAFYDNYQAEETETNEEIVLEEELGELDGELVEEEISDEENENSEEYEEYTEEINEEENGESEEPEWIEEEANGEIISFKENEEFKGYVVTAQKGEGITHLARRALAEYLTDEGNGEDLTKEHKIYIEDYLQNRTGTEWLQLGETKSFSENLIEEAIDASKNLNDNQLENLEQFSELVPSLT
jgi:hypothetical protein